MKGIVLLLIGLFSLTYSFAQLVSVRELALIVNSDDNDAEKLLNSKGFAIYKFDSTNTYTQASFALNKNLDDNNADAFVSIANFFGGNKIASTDFGDIKHYNRERNGAEKLGFRFTRTVIPSANKRFHEYKKGNLVLSFWTNTLTPTTQYEIALTKVKQ